MSEFSLGPAELRSRVQSEMEGFRQQQPTLHLHYHLAQPRQRRGRQPQADKRGIVEREQAVQRRIGRITRQEFEPGPQVWMRIDQAVLLAGRRRIAVGPAGDAIRHQAQFGPQSRIADQPGGEHQEVERIGPLRCRHPG